ncbi:FMN-binding protein MioC [Zobellella aerophila]|uniref:FMN-binding protein MioC n=1 Tax=Zobellella aerophila TaxID=870480 RepID=A0ABP6WFV0_9GAMM
MSHFTLLVGTTLGNAEDLADHLAERLQDLGHQTVIHTSPQLDHILIKPDHYLLLICSTHGAGDLPDNIEPFYQQLTQRLPDLSGLKFGAIGLGDSSYDSFCAAIQKLDHQLTRLDAERIGSRLEIDVGQPDLPEQAAERWLDHWLNQR